MPRSLYSEETLRIYRQEPGEKPKKMRKKPNELEKKKMEYTMTRERKKERERTYIYMTSYRRKAREQCHILTLYIRIFFGDSSGLSRDNCYSFLVKYDISSGNPRFSKE